MGKQKSFIIVGSIFLGFFILMLLLTIVSRNIKDTKITFESDLYYVEIGKTRALTPLIFAGGDAGDDMHFNYIIEDSTIVNMQSGYQSHGSNEVECYVFNEFDETGKPVMKLSQTPWHEDDVVTVGEDGYWHVNGVKTNTKANKQYTEKEIETLISKELREIECYYLNGEPTDIPYVSGVTPVRNETTKTWFINDVDTKISYENCAPISLEGLKLGTTKITLTFKDGDKEIVVSTNICVSEPDPKKIEVNAIDTTFITSINKPIVLEYKISAENELAEPIQDVTYSVTVGKEVLVQDPETKAFSASEPGVYKVRISVPSSSFHISKPVIMSTLITIIVLDTTEEQLTAIENARIAIENIGTLVKNEECENRYSTAKTAVELVEEGNKEAITNIGKYQRAERFFASETE